MVREITFNNSIINDASSCYVIAEIGNNHQGDVNNAKKLIQAAKSSGASAVKFQRRDNKELFTGLNSVFLDDEKNSLFLLLTSCCC